MKLPALMALIHVDLIGYPHTACIHLIACLMDGVIDAVGLLQFFVDLFARWSKLPLSLLLN